MHQELKNRIREVTTKSGNDQVDFSSLLQLIDEHYDKMEATLSESLAQTISTATPIEVIFDSVTDALLSVSETGTIRSCNKVCTRYFGVPKRELIGSPIDLILPGATGKTLTEFLNPFHASLDDTNTDFSGGEVDAVRASGEKFVAEINASSLDTIDSAVFVISLRDVTGRKDAERALRENEERAKFIGHNTSSTRFMLFTISSVVAGVSGGLFALFQEFVSTGSLDIVKSLDCVIMLMIGGMNHLLGPLVGSLFIVFVGDLLSGLTDAWEFYIGMVFIAMMLFFRGGLVSIIQGLVNYLKTIRVRNVRNQEEVKS